MQAPAVRAAEAGANSAGEEAKAARPDRLPVVTGGIIAGRYGVLETERDYDVRGQLALRWQLFDGAGARAQAATARVDGAEARARRVVLGGRRSVFDYLLTPITRFKDNALRE